MGPDFSHIAVIEDSGECYLPKPGEEDLARFEVAHKLKLPASYRRFCHQFGAGELSGYFRIAAPLSVTDDYDLGIFNSRWHGRPGERLLEVYGPSEVTDQLLFFGATIGGEAYVWRLSEFTSRSENERSINFVPRAPPLERVAENFAEFILEVTQRPVPNDPEWKPTLEFRRFVRG